MEDRQNQRLQEILLRRMVMMEDKVRDLEEFKTAFEMTPEEISGLSDKIKKQEREIKEQKIDLIQYFGLFVAIFTAISIDIQLLKYAHNIWQVTGLMFMINTAPLFFFFLIRWVYKDKFDWSDFMRFILFFSMIFGVGTGLLLLGKDETFSVKNDIENKVEEEFVKEDVKVDISNLDKEVKTENK